VKDVEANAEKSGEFRVRSKTGKAGLCSFRKFGPMAQIGRMMKRKNLPMLIKILEILVGRSVKEFIFCFQRLREYKEVKLAC
jgi:hypothetical protein